jgi:hypothetical protein
MAGLFAAIVSEGRHDTNMTQVELTLAIDALALPVQERRAWLRRYAGNRVPDQEENSDG